MTDLSQLAKGLSDVQREVILHGKCAVPRGHDEWSSDCICDGGAATSQLVQMGLAHARRRYPNGIVLTDIGQRLRTHLKEASDNG
jgi:hypothetical protein